MKHWSQQRIPKPCNPPGTLKAMLHSLTRIAPRGTGSDIPTLHWLYMQRLRERYDADSPEGRIQAYVSPVVWRAFYRTPEGRAAMRASQGPHLVELVARFDAEAALAAIDAITAQARP